MEDEETERLSVLKRMCRLSCVLLLVALATIFVGILAVTHSSGKFPFNAGGAIIAGLVASIMSICPMCLLVQAKQYQSTRKSSYGCCYLAMVIWSFIAILGIIFGLAVNGVAAIIACNNRSEETGCWLNKETQFALAIVTVVLTGLLLLIVTTLFVICFCNCVLVGDVTDMENFDSHIADYINDVYRIPTTDMTPGHTMFRVQFEGVNDAGSTGRDNGQYTTPTAPPIFTQYTSDMYNTLIAPNRDIPDLSYNENDHENSPRYYRNPYAFESPPPSYNEVMESDPMETPL